VDLAHAKRLFFIALIASLSATAALAILFLLFAELDETTGRILVTTLQISVVSLFALPAGVLLDQGRYAGLAWTVIVLSAVAFALAMVVTWQSSDDDGELVWKALATTAAFAGASSQAAMTTSRRRRDDADAVRFLYLASLGLAGLLAVLIATAAWAEVGEEWYYRALGAVAIADVLLVIVQSLARRLPAAPAEARERRSHRVVFELDRAPSEEAIAAAASELERAGVRVKRVEQHA
jgi:FtsH-binding integral membrane protein